MATRGKAISVKIATPKVIKALESALVKLNLNYSSQEANEAKYDKAVEEYNKEIAKIAMTQFSKAENVRVNVRAWNKSVNVDFDLPHGLVTFPEEPTRDYESIHFSTYRASKQELENAISILKMTDEETVSTSTYQAVARYL
jgi:CO dehydrogenase/acetyl-CoA synthase delta subunit